MPAGRTGFYLAIALDGDQILAPVEMSRCPDGAADGMIASGDAGQRRAFLATPAGIERC